MSIPKEQHESSEGIQSDAELSGDDLEEASGGIIDSCVPRDEDDDDGGGFDGSGGFGSGGGGASGSW